MQRSQPLYNADKIQILTTHFYYTESDENALDLLQYWWHRAGYIYKLPPQNFKVITDSKL